MKTTPRYGHFPNPHWPTAEEIRQQIDTAERQLHALYCGENPSICDDVMPACEVLALRIQGLYENLRELEPGRIVVGPHQDAPSGFDAYRALVKVRAAIARQMRGDA